MRIAAILLAAGRSRRFGTPKLAANLGGRPLCTYAAATIAQIPCAARIAIVGPDTPDLAEFGFHNVSLRPAGAPLSRSIVIGVEAAMSAGANGVLIALADMPFVPITHFQTLLARFDGHVIATRVAGKVMPPAIFGDVMFPALRELTGDSGARLLLHGAPSIELPPELGLDIDTESDRDFAEELWRRSVRLKP